MDSVYRKLLQMGCVMGFGVLLAINAKPLPQPDIEPQLTAGASKLPLIDWRETEVTITQPQPEIVITTQAEVVEQKIIQPTIPELYDFDLLALTVQAEGYTMGYTGMRYITSSIINLARDRGCSIDEVITSGAYTVVNNGTIWKQTLYDDTIRAVEHDLYIEQIDTEIKYFRTNHYHSFGTPCFNWGNVYFNK